MTAAERTGRPRVVVGVDGSPSSLAAFRWAVRQARLTGGEVLAVTAWHLPVACGYPMPVAPLTGAHLVEHATCPVVVIRGADNDPSDRNGAASG